MRMFENQNKYFALAFRVLMAWTFLYSASKQAFNPNFSIVGLVTHTKTFNGLFSIFNTPGVAPIISFLVAYGHLLIGISLLLGLLVRVSGVAGAVLMIIYWMAHMDFPYIDTPTDFLIDYHIVYAVLLVFLVVNRAGHVFGLDAMAEKNTWVTGRPWLRSLVA